MMNLFYRCCTSLAFTYDIDPILDKALNDCLDRGLKNILEIDQYSGEVEFNDGTKYGFKNWSLYDSWLHNGYFNFASGLKYNYNGKRPKVKTIYRFKKALENFNFCPVNDDIKEEPFLKTNK